MKMTPIKKNIMNIKFYLLLLFVVAFLIVAVSADAQTVRGRLDREGSSGPYPAAYVKVTLYAPDIGRSSPVYTGSDGMYYFYNVPPGDYILEIWRNRAKTITYSIQILNEPYTDIPSILIP